MVGMDLIQENWELVCICFGIFVNAVGLLYNVIRCVRAGGLRHTGEWKELLAVLRKYECEAQGMTELDGAGKLEYVLARMREYSESIGLAFDREMLEEAVEKDIAFVNEMSDIKSERLE